MLARIVLVILAAAGTLQADERGVAINAKVTAVTKEKAGAGTGSIEVDAAKGPLILLVTDKTKFEIRVGQQRRSASLADVNQGDELEVEISGIIIASCPPQSAAYRVTILSKAK